MAFTATKVFDSVFGNKRMQSFDVTADAASGSVSTGLGYVESITFGPISCATAGFKMKGNLTVASAASNGTVFVSSAASGDRFFMHVYGR